MSRFINQNVPVSRGVAETIQQVMLDLNYQPHAAARHLATRRTRTAGLILHNVHTDFFAALLSGIESVVSENQYNLRLATYKSADQLHSQPSIGAHNTDGTLVFADSLGEEHLAQLCRGKFPVVLIHRTPPGHLTIPFVTVENRAATRRIVSHLIEEHDRRSILFLRGPQEQEDSLWRERGYLEALETHGIPFDAALMLDGEFDAQVAYQNIKGFLGQNRRKFDAVFAGNDDAAVGAMIALGEVGLRVPEDVAVVGFDDARLSPYLSPPLTTVRAPTEEVGRTAATFLFNLINGQPVESATLLPTEIIIRRSCGCA